MQTRGKRGENVARAFTAALMAAGLFIGNAFGNASHASDDAADDAARATISGPACVRDGDTIHIGGKRDARGKCRRGVEVRFHAIDAPEPDQDCEDSAGARWACGVVATDRLRALAEGKPVVCEVLGIDRTRKRRPLVQCAVDGRDPEAEMVRAGMAIAYLRFSDAYAADQEAARSKGVGMWAGTFTEPEKWRRANYK